MAKIKTVILGLEHIHATLLFHSFDACPQIEWVGAADMEPISDELRQTYLEYNFMLPKEKWPKIFKDYREMLDQKPDLALICTDIKGHAAAVEETMSRGIHTVVEKPMATCLEDGKRMYRAAQKSTASLAINWPIAWFPAFRKVKELADSGTVGDVLRVQYRSPSTRGPYKLGEHSNEELSKLWWYQHDRGGGSIMDYAGYGCVLSTWINNGKIPRRVSGFKKNFFLPFSDVEDYSVFTLEYDRGVSVIEGSWSTMNNGEIATGPVVYGTEGVIVGDRFDPQVKVYKDLKPYQPSPKPTQVFDTKNSEENIAANVLNHIENGAPLFEMLTPDFNLRAMAALDAGIRSCETGQIVYTDDPFGV